MHKTIAYAGHVFESEVRTQIIGKKSALHSIVTQKLGNDKKPM
jgi:hypothetical protein